MNPITGNHTIFIEETGSTNEALKLEEQFKQLPEGTVLYTHYQNNGKGQVNAKWESEPNQNILLSVLYNPRFLKIEEQMYLNLAVALACRQFLAALLPLERVKIKWPNDLVVKGGKIAGILIENTIAGSKLKSSIVGIGININQLKFEVEHALSVAQLTAKEQDLAVCRKHLYQSLDTYYNLLQMKKFDLLKSQYESYLLQKGEIAQFIIKGSKQEGEILGIGNQGKLYVLVEGEILSFMNKELVYCSLKSSNE